MDISIALENLGAGTPFDYSGSLTGNDEATYNALTWNDGRTKPAWAAVTAEWAVYELSDAKVARIAVMKAAFNADVSAGFTTNSILMDADEGHISRFKVGYDLAILESEATMDIIDFNNATQAAIDVADALTMIRALGVNARTKRFQLQARRTSINAAATVNDVNAINW